MPGSERYFPTLKDVIEEFLTPADWERIFGERSNKKPGREYVEKHT